MPERLRQVVTSQVVDAVVFKQPGSYIKYLSELTLKLQVASAGTVKFAFFP